MGEHSEGPDREGCTGGSLLRGEEKGERERVASQTGTDPQAFEGGECSMFGFPSRAFWQSEFPPRTTLPTHSLAATATAGPWPTTVLLGAVDVTADTYPATAALATADHQRGCRFRWRRQHMNIRAFRPPFQELCLASS